jgi:hypothetical protein
MSILISILAFFECIPFFQMDYYILYVFLYSISKINVRVILNLPIVLEIFLINEMIIKICFTGMIHEISLLLSVLSIVLDLL